MKKIKHRYKTVTIKKKEIKGGHWFRGNNYYFENFTGEPVTITITRRERIHYGGKKDGKKETA